MGFLAGLKRMRTRISECPHPTKVRFDTKRKAERRAEQLGMEAYECVCGKWHLTGQCTREPACPICGAPIDEYTSCGCFEDLHYGD